MFLLTVWSFFIVSCKEYNQSDFSVDYLLLSMSRVISCVVGRGCLVWLVHSLGKTLWGRFLKYQDWLKTQLFGPVKWASTQFCIKFQSQKNYCDIYFKWDSLNRMIYFYLRNISWDLAFSAWMDEGLPGSSPSRIQGFPTTTLHMTFAMGGNSRAGFQHRLKQKS